MSVDTPVGLTNEVGVLTQPKRGVTKKFRYHPSGRGALTLSFVNLNTSQASVHQGLFNRNVYNVWGSLFETSRLRKGLSRETFSNGRLYGSNLKNKRPWLTNAGVSLGHIYLCIGQRPSQAFGLCKNETDIQVCT